MRRAGPLLLLAVALGLAGGAAAEPQAVASALDRPAADGVAAAPSRPEAKPPYLLMRELEQMQDRIAAGDALAAAAHAKAISRTAVAFAAAKPAAWGEARNARALILYLFSGGNAAAIGAAIPRSALPKGMGELYDGALAYGLGDDERARKALVAIDPRGLPTALGGHLALVQAALVADPAKAMERLDLARLLEPGTLVEEAALRKAMGLIDARTGDLAKFAMLARRYAAGFPRSVYYPNYRQLVRQAAMAVAKGDGAPEGAAESARLALVVEALEPRDRRRLLLAVARDALMAGRMATAATVAEQVLDGKSDGKSDGKGDGRGDGRGEADRARALVYFGAATIAGPHDEAARAALAAAGGAAAKGGLDAADEALRLAALSVADTIHDPGFAAPPSRSEAGAAAIREGDRALADADAAMKVAGR